MGSHIDEDGRFQSDKYPSTPPDCVPLKVTDPTAQGLLAEYARRRRVVDAGFADDLEARLRAVGFEPDDHHVMDDPRTVCFYEQDYYALSNFSAFKISWSGHDFDTSEAAYQWKKFHAVTQAPICQRIRLASSAHEVFRIAQDSADLVRSDWSDIRVGVMKDILRTKARQHEYVSRKLLSTGDRRLVENSWRDDFWGWGQNRTGKNMLGLLWMQIRDELRQGVSR